MPSQKPRIALTMPPELDAALKDMAEALNRPTATLLVEFLVDLIPQFQGIAKLARAAKSGNKAATKQALVHMVGDQFAQVMAMQQPELFAKAKKK